jgi:hypothetical protein
VTELLNGVAYADDARARNAVTANGRTTTPSATVTTRGRLQRVGAEVAVYLFGDGEDQHLAGIGRARIGLVSRRPPGHRATSSPPRARGIT